MPLSETPGSEPGASAIPPLGRGRTDPFSAGPRCRAYGFRSHLAGLKDRRPRQKSNAPSQRKERESNPQGLAASSRFERGAIASWLALPSIGSEGFEPSPPRLKVEHAAVTPRPRECAGNCCG